MNIVSKWIISIVISLALSITLPTQAHIFLDAAQGKVDKITDQKPIPKSPLEFKQSVMRYIKNTDVNCVQNVPRSSDENSADKKELRYLFKNYGNFSAITLLSRLRSAHQTMVKQDSNGDPQAYQRYEQICSALLLTVSQVLYSEMRNQILHALHDIDNLLVYWHYQHNHQVYYFLHKSPIKWIMGKEQEKEIARNIIKLERKQRELYILLGSLTEHVHSFSSVEIDYQECYTWIEQLLEIANCLKISSQYNTDESRFDEIATVLELKLKLVATFKADCLASIATAKKPSRFIRNWILYSTALATVAYMAHYNCKKPEVIPSALKAIKGESSKFLILLLHPLQKIYERGKLAFSTEKKVKESKREEKSTNEPENQLDPHSKPESIDREAQLMKLLNEIKAVGQDTKTSISEELKKSNAAVRKDGLNELKKAIELMKDPQDGSIGNVGHSNFEYDEEGIKKAIATIETIIEPIKKDNRVLNQQEVDDYKAAVKYVVSFIDTYSPKMGWATEYGRSVWCSLNLGNILIRADNDNQRPLQKYTEILDDKVLKIFQIGADIVENVGMQANDLFKDTKDLEIQAKQQLKDHELTLMFTSLIPLGITGLAANKAYKWFTSHDYSHIRIALSEVNALLIEAANNLDDYHYGKLVYLICKLRHRSTYLKDSLANEFLNDVAKLESKQYSAQTKHGIVENMFNKYAFLGKIAV